MMDTVVNSNAAAPAAAVEETAGANEQKVAESAASGGEVREVAEPGAQGGTNTVEQSPDERHRQAEARRKAERESDRAQIRKEIEEENAKHMDAFVASMGRVNPYTKKPIKTMAELKEYNDTKAQREREEKLSKLGLSSEDFDALVNNHPTVRAAEEALASINEQKAQLASATRNEELRAELAEIQKIDPNIKDPLDLMNHPMYSEVKRLVQENNHSIAEAFRIATEPQRAKDLNDRVRQSAAQAAAGKSHLSSVAAVGGTAPQVEVPPNVMANYRRVNPKITEEEARKKYARYLGLPRI